MATVDVLNADGKKVSTLELKEGLFDGKVNEALFYEVVKMQLASRRAGTASTKTRAEVRGSGAKPWKQKGSGRARVGSKRSPIWRHGGVTFGPKPRDYSYKVPKKVVRGALKSALQLKINEGKLRILDTIELKEPRSKEALELFGKAKLTSALVVTDGRSRNLELATRNLQAFKAIDVAGLNVYDVLRYDELVMAKNAFEKVESTL
ncbi:MAG: 50S ribosomal protein L4 [Thermodesulfobacteriota bacterium]